MCNYNDLLHTWRHILYCIYIHFLSSSSCLFFSPPPQICLVLNPPVERASCERREAGIKTPAARNKKEEKSETTKWDQINDGGIYCRCLTKTCWKIHLLFDQLLFLSFRRHFIIIISLISMVLVFLQHVLIFWQQMPQYGNKVNRGREETASAWKSRKQRTKKRTLKTGLLRSHRGSET